MNLVEGNGASEVQMRRMVYKKGFILFDTI